MQNCSEKSLHSSATVKGESWWMRGHCVISPEPQKRCFIISMLCCVWCASCQHAFTSVFVPALAAARPRVRRGAFTPGEEEGRAFHSEETLTDAEEGKEGKEKWDACSKNKILWFGFEDVILNNAHSWWLSWTDCPPLMNNKATLSVSQCSFELTGAENTTRAWMWTGNTMFSAPPHSWTARTNSQQQLPAGRDAWEEARGARGKSKLNPHLLSKMFQQR